MRRGCRIGYVGEGQTLWTPINEAGHQADLRYTQGTGGGVNDALETE